MARKRRPSTRAAHSPVGQRDSWADQRIPQTLDLFHRRYNATRNPLWAWQAYDIARHYRADTPKWVLGYFDTVAVNLHYVTGWATPRRRKIAPAIMRALGFVNDGIALPPEWRDRELQKSGRYNPFEEVNALRLVNSSMDTLPGKRDIERLAAQLGISSRTIKRRLRQDKK